MRRAVGKTTKAKTTKTRAVFGKITEGKEEGEIWSATSVWSTERTGLRLVPADQVATEFALTADRDLGPDYNVAILHAGRARVLRATA